VVRVASAPILTRFCCALVAVPCAALALVSAWWFAGAVVGGGGLWPPDQVTLIEAVATRNNAEALRLLSKGADPNQPGRVRQGLVTGGYDVTMKPVEAAVAAQRADTLRMLLASGALVDDTQLLVLRCLERARRDSGVREILDARAAGEPECAGVNLPIDRPR
jgi:hypothetical protein